MTMTILFDIRRNHLRSRSDIHVTLSLSRKTLAPKTIKPSPTDGLSLRSLSNGDIPHVPSAFLNEAKFGIISHPPELCPDGTGGTYFMKNTSNKTVAVFKPKDECPLSQLNPKRSDSDSPLHFKGILPGEGASREVLAYQVAPDFFNVPETHMAEINHWAFNDGKSKNSIKRKCGSFQKFIPGMKSAEDIGSSVFPLEDVQKIALLDLLLVNCDRNGGNILVHPDTHQLVPIDHSFSLPDYRNLQDLQWFEWMNYRQSRQPVSEKLIDFVKSLDIKTWCDKAKSLHIRSDCILTMELAFILVSKALSANKTLFDIGKLMCSPSPRNPSLFSRLVAEAQSVNTAPEEIRNSFSDLVSTHLSL